MNFPIPSFIPVPSAETMQLISIVSLIVGICVTVAGSFPVFEQTEREQEKHACMDFDLCRRTAHSQSWHTTDF